MNTDAPISSAAPRAGVVVITHDVPAEMLRDCLGALIESGDADQVLIVDNGRRDRPLQLDLPSGAPTSVEVLSVPNRGFGAAANVGIFRLLEAGCDPIAVLNDDVVVEPGWLRPLVALLTEAAAGERLGAVQPKLLLAGTDPAQINSTGVELGPDGAGRDRGYGEPDGPDHDRAGPIELFTGGAVVLRAAFIAELGGFDERYRLYYEDVDLALRGAERGWRYHYQPTIRVHHAQGTTTGAAGLAGQARFLQERNRLWILWRFGSPASIGRGLWLSVRRLRHPPRRVHARALAAGLRGAPTRVIARSRARRDRRDRDAAQR